MFYRRIKYPYSYTQTHIYILFCDKTLVPMFYFLIKMMTIYESYNRSYMYLTFAISNFVQ